MNRKKTPYNITVLQLTSSSNYQQNLEQLLTYIQASSSDLILAPEVCLTGFDYAHFDQAAAFFDHATKEISSIVDQQIVVLTLIRKEQEGFVNQAVVIHKHRLVYQQNKHKLFTVGDETKYFIRGQQEKIQPFEINGIRYGLLICFELRFKELWKQLEGVDLLLIPSMWGKPRKKHLEILSTALAIMNQSFVVVGNAANEDMAKSSAILSPWGEVVRDDTQEVIQHTIDLKEIKKVHRLIPMR